MTSLLARIMPKDLWVRLPYTFDLKTMYVFIDKILDTDLQPRSSRVKLDFSILHFVDPTAITVLANLIEYLRKQKVRVAFANHTFATDGNQFLDDSGFFKAYDGKQVFPKSSLRKTTLPLQQVAHDKSFSWIHHEFGHGLVQK